MPETGRQPTMVSGEPGPAVRGRRRRRLVTTVSGAAAAILALTAVALPAQYNVESPGPTFNTIGEIDEQPVISVSGAETYPTTGNLDLTTVYVSGPPTGTTPVLDLLAAWANPAETVTPRELVYPTGTTSDEVEEQNSASMATSQSWSVAAALENLGIDYRQHLFVRDFTPQSRAGDLLQTGDQVVTADGQEITGLQGLKDRLNESGGEPVELGVVRDGEETSVEVPVYPGASGEWLMGVFLDSDFEFPLEVDITLENVGGPSAGMMFALGLIDELTPGGMAGDQHIAGTGTIDPDGTVGEIGGIVQKVIGAADSGARHFLAPAGNCAELAGQVSDGMDVYAVSTLEEARAAVEAIGQGESPDGPRCG